MNTRRGFLGSLLAAAAAPAIIKAEMLMPVRKIIVPRTDALVFVNGLLQAPGMDYTESGDTIRFAEPLRAGDMAYMAVNVNGVVHRIPVYAS